MKNSEKLHQEAKTEENDLAYLGKMNQVIREKRLEKWEDWRKDILTSPYVVTWDENIGAGKVTMFIYSSKLEKQTIDYFPKANKVLIRKENKWVKPGLRWLIKNLIVVKDE